MLVIGYTVDGYTPIWDFSKLPPNDVMLPWVLLITRLVRWSVFHVRCWNCLFLPEEVEETF
jgi:hypothetical protein